MDLLRKFRKNYEENIRTCRIINDSIQYIDEIKDTITNKFVDVDFISDIDDKVGMKNNAKSNILITENIKGKKSLEAMLNQEKNKKFYWIGFISYFIYLVAFILSIWDYISLKSFFDSINDRSIILDLSYNRMSYEQGIMYVVREMYLLQK